MKWLKIFETKLWSHERRSSTHNINKWDLLEAGRFHQVPPRSNSNQVSHCSNLTWRHFERLSKHSGFILSAAEGVLEWRGGAFKRYLIEGSVHPSFDWATARRLPVGTRSKTQTHCWATAQLSLRTLSSQAKKKKKVLTTWKRAVSVLISSWKCPLISAAAELTLASSMLFFYGFEGQLCFLLTVLQLRESQSVHAIIIIKKNNNTLNCQFLQDNGCTKCQTWHLSSFLPNNSGSWRHLVHPRLLTEETTGAQPAAVELQNWTMAWQAWHVSPVPKPLTNFSAAGRRSEISHPSRRLFRFHFKFQTHF